jgi:hypothetical protein
VSEVYRYGEGSCEWEVQAPDSEFDPCGQPSRFLVQRSDHDPSYDATADRVPAESCEAHLAETVMALMDGNDAITAVVVPRWN